MMIITDSASDITKQEALEMNIRIVSLKIRFSDGEFHQNTEEDFSVFFEKLAAEKDLPTTSQPSPEEFLELYEEAKDAGEEVLVITLSSGLSGTVNAANLAKQMAEYEKNLDCGFRAGNHHSAFSCSARGENAQRRERVWKRLSHVLKI